ncbi:WD40 repeat domain-containing serine/threonine protein kinase [Stieleria sp. JC731]|uniref:WD40 repeat domain-containing serine/threonine protein kinase n=1 Tax=Pirellulaceae TaxID=2691357 RepID=UPI001E28B7A5|nr:WD40 repeat domain-containing serine/threonine protein kinase [Stieleria sp. JC731]MCC9600952.1 WD40 repeat domain-containing serine/threonine protein kinase [Stieleria sp. JC731]
MNRHRSNDSSDESSDGLIAEYLRRVKDGSGISPETFIAGYPKSVREDFLQSVRLMRRTSTPVTSQSGDEASLGLELPFRQLKNFELLRLLSSGGMGIVYVAREIESQQLVALKLVRQSTGNPRKRQLRLQRESRAVKALAHPNIVPVIDSGVESGVAFLAMQMIDGVALDYVINAWQLEDEVATGETITVEGFGTDLSSEGIWGTTPLSESDASLCASSFQNHNFYQLIAERMADVADAVHTAHAAGIIHRDVKPSNILLDVNGKAWLTDFGLASFEEELTELTQTDDLIGTPAYMSPEQASGGSNHITHLSDVYGLGASIFEMVTLQKPFQGDRHQMLQDILDGRFSRPTKVRKDVPVQLEAIICKAMALQPRERYASAAELSKDLRDFASGLQIRATLPTRLQKALRWCERNSTRAALILSGIVFLIVTAFAIQSYHSWSVGRLNAELSEANEDLKTTYQLLDSSQQRLQRELYLSDMQSAFAALNERDVTAANDQLNRVAKVAGAPRQLGTPFRLLDQLIQMNRSRLIGRHSGAATEFLISPDQKSVVSVGHDGTIRHHDLDGHELGVIAVGGKLDAIAADRSMKTILTGINQSSEANRVQRVSLSDGAKQDIEVSQPNSIEATAVSPSGKWFASAERYGQVIVFNQQETRARWDSESRNESLAFLNDDQLFGILDSMDGHRRLYLWDIPTGRERFIDTNYRCEYFALAYPNSEGEPSHILTASPHDVSLLSWPEGEVIAYRENLAGRIRCVDISSDGNRIVAGTDQGTVFAWDVSELPFDRELPPPRVVNASTERITDIELIDRPTTGDVTTEPRHLTFLTSSESGTLEQWMFPNETPLVLQSIKNLNPNWIYEPFQCENAPTLLYFPFGNGKVVCLDVETLAIHEICDLKESIVGPGILLEQRIYAPTQNGIVEIEAGSGTVLRRFESPDGAQHCAGMVRCGSNLVAAFGNVVAVYDLDQGVLQRVQDLGENSVRQIASFPGTADAVILTEKNLFRWQNGEARLWKRTETSGTSFVELTFSACGQRMALVQEDGISILNLVDSSESVLNGYMHRVSDLQFIDDDTKLMAAFSDGSLRFWDLSTGREIGRLENSTCPVFSVFEFPRLGKLITSHPEGDVACWQLAAERKPVDRSPKESH